MEEGKDMRKHLNELNKIMLILSSISVRTKEEDQAIILLSSFPQLYEHFVDTMLYGKQTLTMTEVKAALNSKELQMKSKGKKKSDGEDLTVRERPQKRDNKTSRGKSRSKSKVGRKCFFCHKEGHYKKNVNKEEEADKK